MLRLRRMSSKPVMMLPILNTNEMELVIWAGEGLIHAFTGGELEPADGGLGYGGGIMTPGIARNATFPASITVDCPIYRCQDAWISRPRGKNVDLHKEQTPSIRKPAFAWTLSTQPQRWFRLSTDSRVPANELPGRRTRVGISIEKASSACDCLGRYFCIDPDE